MNRIFICCTIDNAPIIDGFLLWIQENYGTLYLSFVSLNSSFIKNKIILLDYKRELNFKFSKKTKNIWTFTDQIQKTKSINKIEFTTINNEETHIEGTLNLYKVNSMKQKKLIYKKKINQVINSGPININFET